MRRAERFREVLGDRPRARVLIETSTESEWVATCCDAAVEAATKNDPAVALLRTAPRIGPITRAGDTRTRCLLVQASQRIRYSKVPETLGLRMWAERIELRRRKAVATRRWHENLPGSSSRCSATGRHLTPASRSACRRHGPREFPWSRSTTVG